MIAVPVREDQVIDLRDARVPGGVEDATRVPCRAHAPVPRIDEQRLARGRDDERRVPPFDIDDIDVQRLRGARLRRHERRARSERQQAEPSTHRRALT